MLHEADEVASALPEGARDTLRTAGALAEGGFLGDASAPAYAVHVETKDAAHAEIGQALLHPRAVFVPDAMEWVLRREDVDEVPVDLTALRTLLLEGAADVPGFYISDVLKGPAPFPRLLRHTQVDTGDVLVVSAGDSVSQSLPADIWTAFRLYREQSPGPGMTPHGEVARAVALLVRILGNALAGMPSAIPIQGKAFTQQLRWDPTSEAVMTSLGWYVAPLDDGREALHPPAFLVQTDKLGDKRARPETVSDDDAADVADAPAPDTPLEEYAAQRQRTTRTWLELAAWCVHLGGTPPSPECLTWTLSVSVDTSFALLGRYVPPPPLQDGMLRRAYARLGSASNAAPAVLCDAYRVNAAAYPHRGQELFLALELVAHAHPSASDTLGMLLAMEKSKGFYTLADVRASFERLGLAVPILTPPENLSVWDPMPAPPLDEAGIVSAYDRAIRDTLDHGTDDDLRSATLALHTIARFAPHARLLARSQQPVVADAADAYRLIQTSEDVDDALVVVGYEVYLAETTTRKELLRAAMEAIAASRDSAYLRRYLAGDTMPDASTPPLSLPRGLENIGNTCYLNSVLQYFFQITTLRTMVQEMGTPALTASAWKDAALPTIGGRQTSEAELDRSCRCTYW